MHVKNKDKISFGCQEAMCWNRKSGFTSKEWVVVHTGGQEQETEAGFSTKHKRHLFQTDWIVIRDLVCVEKNVIMHNFV